MKTLRKVSGAQTYFVIANVEPRYVEAIRSFVYEETANGFARAYPSNAPYLEQAYRNWQEYTQTMVQQRAGEVPVLWEEAMLNFLHRVEGYPIDWWVTGSAALALRGLDVIPGDIDLITSADDAVRLGKLLVNEIVQPVQDTTGWVGKWFCRSFLGATVEWVGGVNESADAYGVSDFGPVAAGRLETIEWHGHPIRVPPLDLQLAVNERRGRLERAALIRAAQGSS